MVTHWVVCPARRVPVWIVSMTTSIGSTPRLHEHNSAAASTATVADWAETPDTGKHILVIMCSDLFGVWVW